MRFLGRISRRGLLGTAAALGAASVVGRDPARVARAAAHAARPPTQLPPRGELIIRGAYVLTMDPALGDLERGDVHVRNGAIVAVGTDLVAPGAEVLDARTMIALPGFVETHWHLWNSGLRAFVRDEADLGYFPVVLRLGQQFTPEDVYRGVRLGVAEALYSGITTVHDWSHNIRGPEYADADLSALRDVGIRARFSYGTSQGYPSDRLMDLADLARVHREWFGPTNDGLLTLGMASRTLGVSARGPAPTDVLRQDWAGARRLGVPITLHATRAGEVTNLQDEGLLGPDLQLVHPVATTAAERELLAANGTTYSTSPTTELRLGIGFPQLGELLAAGVVTSLSLDTTALSANADMFSLMRMVQDVENARQGDPLAVVPRQVLELATLDGARDLGIADRVGSLTPGKRADLILVRTTDLNLAPVRNPANALVHAAQPANVDTVIVDGRILKRHGQLTALDVEQVVREAAESVASLQQRAGWP